MSVCDVPVISAVCDAVGQGAATLIAAPFDWLAQAMGGAAAWLFEAVLAVVDTTTLVDVNTKAMPGSTTSCSGWRCSWYDSFACN